RGRDPDMTLRLGRRRADKRQMSSLRVFVPARFARDERGQAVVEFALVLPVFLILVAGIIQFGVALNYWLDGQRIANQGARWAVVNNWPPDCPQGSTSCTGADTLQATMKRQLLTKGEQNTTIAICFPAADPGAATPYSGKHVGDPVRVTLERPFKV